MAPSSSATSRKVVDVAAAAAIAESGYLRQGLRLLEMGGVDSAGGDPLLQNASLSTARLEVEVAHEVVPAVGAGHGRRRRVSVVRAGGHDVPSASGRARSRPRTE
ncbi:hypothetical protein ACFZAR_00670 [Streptomyces sp. NPDC008222]|uniref:hypothetical protein n=1 Tax=Streptomyces sp. NPDC008222 TaxID=3364820 RepID=UPI0036E2A7EA